MELTLKIVKEEVKGDKSVKGYENDFYEVRCITGKDILPTILIRPKKDYAPSIYTSLRFTDDKFDVEIQTTSYGAIPVKDYANFIEGVNAGFETGKQIEKMLDGMGLLRK